MAHLTQIHLPEKSEKFLESLGFRLQTSISVDSVWSNYPFGALYIDVKHPPETITDVLKIVKENTKQTTRYEVEQEFLERLEDELEDFIEKKIFRHKPKKELTYA